MGGFLAVASRVNCNAPPQYMGEIKLGGKVQVRSNLFGRNFSEHPNGMKNAWVHWVS
jgi:hypothetical protein